MTRSDADMEQLLRDVYRRRASAPASSELADGIAAIPSEVRPDGPRWASLGGAAAVLAAALVIGLMGYDWIRRVDPIVPGGSGAAVFDPLSPGGGLVPISGVTFDGLRDLGQAASYAILFLLLALVAWAVIQGVLQRIKPRPAQPKPTRPKPTKRDFAVSALQFTLFVVVWTAISSVFSGPAISEGSTASHGIGFSEQRSDGVRGLAVPDGGIIWHPDGGPRDIYAVEPGEPITYSVTIQNNWGVGVRLLGRWIDSQAVTDATEPPATTPTGLGLLRDPARLDASIDNVRPFSSIDLAPGQEVVVVVAEVARPCADPSKIVAERTSRRADRAPRVEFVYEFLGIEGIGSVALSPEVTVPSNCPDVP